MLTNQTSGEINIPLGDDGTYTIQSKSSTSSFNNYGTIANRSPDATLIISANMASCGGTWGFIGRTVITGNGTFLGSTVTEDKVVGANNLELGLFLGSSGSAIVFLEYDLQRQRAARVR